MKEQLLECIPNFSEGRNAQNIEKIVGEIVQMKGIHLLGVEPGKGANRTVVTFAGPPQKVIDAAFAAIKKASELIDMRLHTGAHPRLGATDVCPLVPIANLSLQDAAVLAHKLGARVGRELEIPVYMYEAAALHPQRRDLANIRSGEYEGLTRKILMEDWKPDYGPSVFNAKSGACAIGARNYLVAYNVNLATTSVSAAKAIARSVRESGYVCTLSSGRKVRVKGSHKGLKAIGWFIEEYGFAQVSMNLVKLSETGIHQAFLACKEAASKLGVAVTGSELIGLIPLWAILEAGRHFLEKETRVSEERTDKELIQSAIHGLGLNAMGHFNPSEKIIEYKIGMKDYGFDTMH